MAADLTDLLVAFHEAAHAVLSYRLLDDPGYSVSIVPDETHNRRGYHEPGDGPFDAHTYRAEILVLYAGGHAQRRIDPASGNDGCWGDDETAEAHMDLLSCRDQEDALRAESLRLVTAHWKEIEAVARELIEHRVLDDSEIALTADAAVGNSDAATSLLGYRQLKAAMAERRQDD